MRDLKNNMVILACIMVAICITTLDAAIPSSIRKTINDVNKKGSYLGIVVPNAFEMNPLLNSSNFVANSNLPYLDVQGRRFHLGTVKNQKVIMVMTGLSMLNSGLTTQLLLTLFEIKGIVHFGIAGNANSNLQIGDVTIPKYWAHTGLWNWQRYGFGPQDELAFEAFGDYTRQYGYLNFSDYDVDKKKSGSYLNSVWYQPEEVFPVTGTPEERQHAFWVEVDQSYYKLSEKLEGTNLTRCVNATTCLPRSPIVARVDKGCSANVFVDNAAYRQFLNTKFNITPIDMETAAVGLVSLQLGTPFIAIRSLSDLAGGGSAQSNEASIYSSLAADNAVTAVVNFISLLS
ncbi:5'-methylthioadenosine/S-adenosylhomocysteine nucleosidase [Rhynchospora pubera]|uniref:5'-methylthioadenosine/S-adenosylhomocysteine nucleosidase n=1 Tax=Rhynchospora pubera TaxID=906938 RepID=A0AAV8FLV3_9POAL|nr:5'-methylthioadenosine/S-adenosylhomocysteine nucleosidase [Rhynchospora pubera]KAJ4794495.1 5'-methylthioadenosine/S-adenosylhomocysteine nucleosidase [Rhynchospora pubera]